MKRKLTLSILMLGVMMLFTLSAVSATLSQMSITQIKLDGQNQVTVSPNQQIDSSVTVYLKNYVWKSTRYKIQTGEWTCVNTNDHTSDGTYTESFPINAPLSPGTYDFSVQAYQWANCQDGSVTSGINDGIIVVAPQEPVCGNGQLEAGEQCDDGNTANGDGCSSTCTIEQTPSCTLTVTNPTPNEWFDNDSIPIEWTLSEGCTPIDYFFISYKNANDGPCTDLDHNWHNVTVGANGDFGSGDPYSYLWGNPGVSGQYCVKVKVTSNGARDSSDVFNIDLAKPYVNLSVGDPQQGDCTEGTGDCYVNQQTPITLSCSDDNPDAVWQSGPDAIKYTINGGAVQTYDGSFEFSEDSNHVLDYWCYDKVGKESPHKTKNFYVDSESPTITKTVGDPKVSGCDFEAPNAKCDYYVNQSTKICLTATAGNQDHPLSGDISLSCEYTYWSDFQCHSELGHVNVQLDENGCFNYNEDSYHELHCTATDALGNSKDMYEADIVDSAAPQTRLGFNGPYYSNGDAQWIDSVSTISLNSADPDPHPVGGVTTYYRYTMVDDKYCYGTQDEFTSPETWDQGWTAYTEPFGLPESCHAVQYYSVDALGNTEATNTEFVFSDHTAPETMKEVGKPSASVDMTPLENWYENPGQNIVYKVTMDTPIDLSCQDSDPHPAGVGNAEYSGIWYRIVVDGKYNDSSAQWKFIHTDHTTVQFTEQSEHLLEFYCVDNVNKTSSTDSELFKVDGNAFNLEIGGKWDLISVPFNLLSSNVEDVFGGNSDISSVWGYENGTWLVYYPNDPGSSTLTDIMPGHGYWVKTSGDTTVTIGGNLFNPATTPSSVQINSGWNLIGKYGTTVKSSYCDLFSLVDTTIGFPKWSSLWGYDSGSQSFMPLSTSDSMAVGKGYWLGTSSSGTYMPSSVCWPSI